ncbi:potassium channel family protein [Janibacter alittae]|uniref:Ion channel n=1 Tax=Janibacter alittae TaxID=3115209 RepID=A0ABZ2MGY1_9MICO
MHQPRHETLRSVVAFAAVMLFYYTVPVRSLESSGEWALSVVALLIAVALLGWVITHQVRRQLRAGHETAVRIQSLLLLIYLVVPLFALGYFVIEQHTGNQFADLVTKTDALYFTMTTLATVGFGDVHATGQVARILVTIQMAFNLVFIGTLASVLSDQVRRRAEQVAKR